MSAEIQQTIQWILAGAIPMISCIGVYVATERRSGILLELERLRGDWEAQAAQAAKKAAQRQT